MPSSPSPLLRWGLVFLACPVPLEDEQKVDLVRLAAHAYFTDLGEVQFDWGALRGTVRAASDTVSLGAFCGQRFTAELHRAEGAATLTFLVAEPFLRDPRQPVAEA